MNWWPVVLAASERHNSVLTGTELVALGPSTTWIATQEQRGLLRRVAPNVYLIVRSGRPLAEDERRRIAILHAAPGALLDRHCAAARHGVWDRAPAGMVHVSIPTYARPLHELDVSYRRVAPERLEAHAAMVGGMPCTDLVCSVADMGAVATPWQVASIVDRACGWEHLPIRDLRAHADERRTGHGMAATRCAIALHAAGSRGTQSASEDRAAELLVGHLRDPLAVNVRGITGLPDYEPDFADPVTRRIIEIDGEFHHQADQSARDAARGVLLSEQGWTVLRVDTLDVWRRPRAFQEAALAFLLQPGPRHDIALDRAHAMSWDLALRRRIRARAAAHAPSRARAT